LTFTNNSLPSRGGAIEFWLPFYQEKGRGLSSGEEIPVIIGKQIASSFLLAMTIMGENGNKTTPSDAPPTTPPP